MTAAGPVGLQGMKQGAGDFEARRRGLGGWVSAAA